jgi:hypothetical protein
MVSVLHSEDVQHLVETERRYGKTNEYGSGRDETSRPAAAESEHPQQRHP